MNSKNKQYSFNEEIKQEIINNEFNKENFELILIFFMQNNVEIVYHPIYQQQHLLLKSRTASILEFFAHYLQLYYQIKSTLLLSEKNKGLHKLLVAEEQNISLLNILSYKIHNNEFINSAKTFIKSALIGIYLSSGVICFSKKKNFHCEFAIKNPTVFKLFVQYLNKLKIEFNVYSYNNKTKIYLKKDGMISNFLTFVGAFSAMFKLEEIRVSKDYINNNTRLSNLDLSNLSKSVKINSEQIEMINYLKTLELWNSLPDKLKKYAQIRLDNQEHYYSLNELVKIYFDKYQIEISKSSLNRFAKQIKTLYLTHQKH